MNTELRLAISQAIQTKFSGPTSTAGSKIVAKCRAKTRHIGYKHQLGSIGNHHAAAMTVMKDLGWDLHSDIVGGELFNNSIVWVLIKKPNS